MENLEKFVTIKECTSEKFELKLIDFSPKDKFEKYNSNIVPDVFTIKKTISQTDKSKIKDLLIEKIIELSSIDKEMCDKFSLVDILEEYKDDELLLKRRIIAKFHNASLYIAANGRIGPGNIVLTSKCNYDKLKMSEFTENYEIFLDDRVDDMYIYRKNEIYQPGLILVTFENKYELYDIGFFPGKQFQKIELKKNE